MVKKILSNSVRNGSNILFKKQESILSGALVIALMLFASAVLGLIKNRLYASIITPGPELDVFFAAFRIPDLMFSLLIGGSLNAAFIPLFSQYISSKSKGETWRFAGLVLNTTIIIFLGFAVISFLFANQIAYVVSPGFNDESHTSLVHLMRILLLSPILLGISSFISGILQSFQRFLVPFFSPVIYNLGAILGIVVLYPIAGIEGAAWGVVIGSLGHLLIQLPVLRHVGFKYIFSLKFNDSSLKQLITLSIPRTIGVGIEQIKTFILIQMASFLPAGSISFFDLGRTITNTASSILGLSIAQASLPQFAKLHAQNDKPTLRKTFQSSFNQILFFIMPVTVILIFLKIPVVRLIYGTGEFTWNDTVTTSWVVALMAVGIFANALNNLIVRLFYAMQMTKAPLIMGLISTVISVLLALCIQFNLVTTITIDQIVQIPLSGVGGLAFSISVGSLVEFVLLMYYLARIGIVEWREFIVTPLKIIASACIMSLFIYTPVQILDQVFIDTTLVVNLLILMWLVISTSFTTYLLMTWFLGVRELEVILKVLWKIKDFQKNQVSPSIANPEIPPVIIQTDD